MRLDCSAVGVVAFVQTEEEAPAEHAAEPWEELQNVQSAPDHKVPELEAVAETVVGDTAAVAEVAAIALAAVAGGEVIDWAAVEMGVDNLVAVAEIVVQEVRAVRAAAGYSYAVQIPALSALLVEYTAVQE